MKLLILIILSLLVAVGISTYANSDTGQVIIMISGWKIQTSFNLFLVAIVILLILSHIILSLLRQIYRASDLFSRWQKDSKLRLSQQYLSDGLTAMLQYNWRKAETLFKKGATYSLTPFTNYLAAAWTAQRSGAVERMNNYLHKAVEHGTDKEATVDIVKAGLHIEQQQMQQALSILTRLKEQASGKQSGIQEMLLRAYTGNNNWREVLALLSKIKHKGSMSREQIWGKQLQAYTELLKIAGSNTSEELNNIWSGIPRKLRAEHQLIKIYTEEKLKFSEASDCEPLIRKALKKSWCAKLINLYSLIDSEDTDRQLKFAEGLISKYPQNPALLLALGRLSCKNKLWGKAKNYLQQSLQIHPLPVTHQLLANLLDDLGESEAALHHYQQGLSLIADKAGGKHPAISLPTRRQADAQASPENSVS